MPVEALLIDASNDKDNNHWVLLENSVLLFCSSDTSFQKLKLPAKPFGIEPVFAFGLSDETGLRTDSNGIARLSRYKNRFQTYLPDKSVANSSQTRAMAVDKNNNAWLVNDEVQLLYWDRSRDSWEDRLPNNTKPIKGLEILADGTVWVSVPQRNKILGFDPKEKAWLHKFQFDWLSVAFTQLKSGELIAASKNQIIAIGPQSGQVRKITKAPLKGQLRVFQEDNEGSIWVGTHGNGLAKVESAGQVKTWTNKNSELTSNEIFSLHFDANGLLWIGTWHGGLLSFDPATERFRHYGRDEGLPDTTIFGILEDNSGYLWLSTYTGLVKFRPCRTQEGCQPEITIFTQRDGLQGNEFDAESYFKSDRGEMFFGGAGGFNAFYPDDIKINRQAPAIAISRVEVNGGAIPGTDSEFKFPDTVKLPFDFGELRIKVSVLDFNDPVKNHLQYRDLETGSSWIDMQQPFLLIRGLSDGLHTLQFRGSNNDGVWSIQHASIRILVAPPLYRHPLILIFYLLSVVLVSVLYFRRNRRRLISRQRVLEQEVAKRTQELELANESRERFFANISHEISSPVHMILLMLEKHLDDAPANEKALYKSATGYAAQLMVYLKQLVSGARSHEVDSHLYAADLGIIIKDLVETNQPIARARSVSLDVDPLPPEQVALYTSSAVSIFSNLLCNALVYTPEGGEIRITGEVNGNIYKLFISNTVSEQQATDIDHLFERGIRGKFNANYFGGHGLGLSIVTGAVETLNGSIDVALEDGCKILFTLCLPLAESNMPILAEEVDLAFSHEQMLTIKLTGKDTGQLSDIKIQQGELSVLIIDDDTQATSLTSQLLAESYTVYTAGTCQEGLQLARKYHPDVILCDLYLPDQTGFEILKAIRANRMTMDTFFVVVTASISESDKLKAQELGVDRFVRKPVSVLNLKLLINNHHELFRQRFENLQRDKLIRKVRIENSRVTQQSFETRFTDVLEELYQDSNTTIENFQTRLSMGYAVLMRNCKRTFGKSPKRLLIEKRVLVATELLKTSEYKIGLIGELAGFSTQSQFAIVFKKETGITPSAFRNTKQGSDSNARNST